MISKFFKIIVMLLLIIILRNIGIALVLPIFGIIFALPSVVICYLIFKYNLIKFPDDMKITYIIFALVGLVGCDAIFSGSHPDPNAVKLSFVSKSMNQLAIPIHDFYRINRMCPRTFVDIKGDVSESKLIDPYSKKNEPLKFISDQSYCYVYSIGPDGIDDGAKKVAPVKSDLFSGMVLAMRPVFLHKYAYDLLFGNNKNKGDIVVAVPIAGQTGDVP